MASRAMPDGGFTRAMRPARVGRRTDGAMGSAAVESRDAFTRGVNRARQWWPAEAVDAVRLGLTTIGALYLAMAFQLQKPEWAGWTVLSVSLATRASSLQKSLWRAVGSVCGGVVAIVLVARFAQSTVAFDAALALWLAFASAMASVERGQRSYGWALLGFTVPIVTLGNVEQPGLVFDTAVDRCSTLLLGIACAHASSVLVARSVRTVGVGLAGSIDDAADACAGWLQAADHADPGEPPVRQVLALDTAVADTFTEQSSLRTGGRAVSDAPARLLHVLAAGLLRLRLGALDAGDPAGLIGGRFGAAGTQLGRVRLAGRLLREGRRIGVRHAPARPLAIDRDWRQAANNAVRTAVAVSLVNAFWYFSEWPSGADAATWAALLSVLFAARADAADAARNFMIGAALAAVVGTVVHYTALTASGHFTVLAAVLLPVCMLAALARSDRRAAFGAGYAMVVLTIIGPDNVMQYRLDATLNGVVADLLGMGVAVIAFTALPPPATPRVRRRRARRRMAGDVAAAARRPAILLPTVDRWLARMSDRLAQLAPDGPATSRHGQVVLLAGLLLLALRRDDDRLGREVGAFVTAGRGAALGRVALRPGLAPRQRDRIAALGALLRTAELADWPASVA